MRRALRHLEGFLFCHWFAVHHREPPSSPSRELVCDCVAVHDNNLTCSRPSRDFAHSWFAVVPGQAPSPLAFKKQILQFMQAPRSDYKNRPSNSCKRLDRIIKKTDPPIHASASKGLRLYAAVMMPTFAVILPQGPQHGRDITRRRESMPRITMGSATHPGHLCAIHLPQRHHADPQASRIRDAVGKSFRTGFPTRPR